MVVVVCPDPGLCQWIPLSSPGTLLPAASWHCIFNWIFHTHLKCNSLPANRGEEGRKRIPGFLSSSFILTNLNLWVMRALPQESQNSLSRRKSWGEAFLLVSKYIFLSTNWIWVCIRGGAPYISKWLEDFLDIICQRWINYVKELSISTIQVHECVEWWKAGKLNVLGFFLYLF